jgi:hypothetical protein
LGLLKGVTEFSISKTLDKLAVSNVKIFLNDKSRVLIFNANLFIVHKKYNVSIQKKQIKPNRSLYTRVGYGFDGPIALFYHILPFSQYCFGIYA